MAFTHIDCFSGAGGICTGMHAAGFEIEDTKVLFDDGQIQVFKFGKEAGKCTVSEFSRHPNAMFRRLQWYAEKIENKKL